LVDAFVVDFSCCGVFGTAIISSIQVHLNYDEDRTRFKNY
jgi:hypothetical protein